MHNPMELKLPHTTSTSSSLSLMVNQFSLLFIFFLLPFLSHAAHVISRPNTTKPSSVEFLKHLRGSHKGDHVKGIHQLKVYLEKYGYLNNKHAKNNSHANDDDFDDLLEDAVKTYQLNFHLKPTGYLDPETVSTMITPRCGVPDIINGSTRMYSGLKWAKHNLGFHAVPQYAFFPNNPTWPASKTHLTYAFLPGTNPSAPDAVKRAFQTWSSATQFTFSESTDINNADLTIGFFSGDHGDGLPFDGSGGILAHAFAPTNGRLHYDADETWANGPVEDAFDLETVGLHEIGHLLGLAHTSIEDAIMYPTIPSGTTKGLNEDDIAGIKALYGV